MKKLLFMVLIFVCYGFTANAMEEFRTKDRVYNGLFKFYDKPNIVLIDEYGTIVKINEDSLVSRKRLFDEVHTNKGAVYKLSLIQVNDNSLKFIDEAENELIINRDDFDYMMLDVRRLDQKNWKALADNRKLPEPENKVEASAPDNRKSYTNFGLIFGTPGVLNLMIGYDFRNDWGLRVTGGGISKNTRGIQTDLSYNIKNNKTISSHFYLGCGYLEIEENLYAFDLDYIHRNYSDYAYVAMGLDFNYKGFYANIGLSVGDGDINPPLIMFGLGYVFRFED